MATNFSVDAVKECILARGGRIRNHELVTYFKSFLNHPVDKAINREKFKDFVNELATIKVEEGEKVLVLKRKHRHDNVSSSSSSSGSVTSSRVSATSSDQAAFQPSPAKSPYQPTSDASYSSSAGGSYLPPQPREVESPQFREPKEQAYTPERARVPGDAVRAQSEPPSNGDSAPRDGDQMDGAMMSRVYSDDSLDVRLKSSTRPGMGPGGQKMSFDASTTSLASAESQGSLSSAAEAVSGSGEEEAGNMSVLSIKERVQHLNKMTSESDVQQPRISAARKKTVKDRDDDDESHTSGGTVYVTLTPEEKEWMLVSSTADYHEMFRMLNKSGRLAKVKDISNTALHWAAKFGKPEVVKMLANRIGVNVNQRSGYTPLHLAAIHGHEDVIELLVTVYKADANIRDYSGKKAKQYLKNSASSRAQQLLVSRRIGPDFAAVTSLDDSFTRSVSTRQSNRQRAMSSLMAATSSVMRRQPMLRSSWEGMISDDSGAADKTPGSTPPTSCPTSPASGRRVKEDRHLMPPPHLPSHRRRRGDRSTSSSRESLDSQSHSSSSIDKENSSPSVPRSESDPALARKTFI